VRDSLLTLASSASSRRVGPAECRFQVSRVGKAPRGMTSWPRHHLAEIRIGRRAGRSSLRGEEIDHHRTDAAGMRRKRADHGGNSSAATAAGGPKTRRSLMRLMGGPGSLQRSCKCSDVSPGQPQAPVTCSHVVVMGHAGRRPPPTARREGGLYQPQGVRRINSASLHHVAQQVLAGMTPWRKYSTSVERVEAASS